MRPAARDAFLWDVDLRGFGVKCTPAGKRVFVVQYRTPGGRRSTTKRLTLGEHGPLAVDQARQLARRHLGAVAHGENPAATLAGVKSAPTVGEVSAPYLDEVRAK